MFQLCVWFFFGGVFFFSILFNFFLFSVSWTAGWYDTATQGSKARVALESDRWNLLYCTRQSYVFPSVLRGRCTQEY